MEVLTFYRLYGVISASVLLLLGVAWFAAQSIGENFMLFTAAGSITLAQLVVVARRRRRNLFTLSSLAFWILTVELMNFAGHAARDVAVERMSAMARMKNCSTLDCLGPAGQLVKLGGSEGWLVNRYGANVVVRLYVDRQTECRLFSDYFFGESRGELWTCASPPASDVAAAKT